MSRSEAFTPPIGAALSSVVYELSWEEEPQTCGETDSVSMSVALGFADASVVRFRWLMEGFSEKLAVGNRGPSEPSPITRDFDATARWPSLVGRPLQRVRWALHASAATSAPWSCRLDFDRDSHLVIALGECESDKINYIPDNLVMIRLRSVATGYRPPAAIHSAWGPP